MPTPSPSPSGPRLSRRAALAALAGVTGAALAGCTAKSPAPTPQAQPAPLTASVDPDVSVAAEALASQREILDLISATSERHDALAERLAPVAATHQAHADLLADAVPKGVSVPASPTASASPSASASGLPTTSASPSATPEHERRVTVPRDRDRALAKVAEAERRLVEVTKRQCFRAQSGAFARILGSMAAAAAQNATTLSSPSGAGGAA